jgi:hypothetical protein
MEKGIEKKMIRNALLEFLFACIVVGGSMGPLSVYAEGKSYSLEPFYQEISMDDGALTHPFAVRLANATENDATFRISVADFGTMDETGGIAFLGGGSEFSQRYGLASWMKSSVDQVTVQAGGSESIPIIVENRESLSPGGHYGAVIFEMVSGAEASGAAQISVQSSFASLVFVNKTGGEIRDMAYSGSTISGSDVFGVPSKVSVRFQDKGNTHLVPRGRITVVDPVGRVVREGVINGESGRMLPESFRVFPVSLHAVGRAIVPGPYSIHVDYRYDGKDESIEAPASNMVPIRLAAVWLVIVVVIAISSYRAFRSGKRHEVS